MQIWPFIPFQLEVATLFKSLNNKFDIEINRGFIAFSNDMKAEGEFGCVTIFDSGIANIVQPF